MPAFLFSNVPYLSLIMSLKSIFKERAWVWSPQAFKSHSDANQLWAAGIRPLLLGPGNIEDAHTPNEAVSLGQVVKAAGIYTELVSRLGN